MRSLITELGRPVISVLCWGVVRPMMIIRECSLRAWLQLSISDRQNLLLLSILLVRTTRLARLRRIEWDRVEKAGSQKTEWSHSSTALNLLKWKTAQNTHLTTANEIHQENGVDKWKNRRKNLRILSASPRSVYEIIKHNTLEYIYH